MRGRVAAEPVADAAIALPCRAMSPAVSAAPSEAAAMPSACLNCGESFGESGERRRRFCPECGQETTVRAPTLGEFAQQFGGAYFAAEGALWRSLKLLLLKPGALTLQYLAGRRKHYVLPLRLYLSISLLVLLLLRVLGGGQVDVKVDDTAKIAEENRNFTLDVGRGRAGLRDGVFFCEDLPGWVCKRIQRRVDIDPRRMRSEVESLKDRFLADLGPAMFVLLPSFALWLKLAYRNRQLRYTENLYAENNKATLQELPIITFTGIKQQLADTPFYVSLDSNFTNFHRQNGLQGQRIFLNPRLTFYNSPLQGIETAAWVGYQQRFYNTYGGDVATGSSEIGTGNAANSSPTRADLSKPRLSRDRRDRRDPACAAGRARRVGRRARA
jgi:predicted RNA-binding Zn-ribbon protein involved in translation (DUF1610 family)